METKIISQEKNPFMDREEISLEISAEITPTISDVKTEVGKDENLTVVKKIHTNFGRKTFLAEVFVYGSEESKERVEVIPKKVREKMKEEAKAAAEAKKTADAAETPAEEAAPSEEKAEEAPKEEPAEVPVEENKKETKE
jgi:ribosomal protein S24E